LTSLDDFAPDSLKEAELWFYTSLRAVVDKNIARVAREEG
jgi:hypothetical protein